MQPLLSAANSKFKNWAIENLIFFPWFSWPFSTLNPSSCFPLSILLWRPGRCDDGALRDQQSACQKIDQLLKSHILKRWRRRPHLCHRYSVYQEYLLLVLARLDIFNLARYNGEMTAMDWFGNNWFALLQTGALTGALLIVGVAVWLEARARRVRNLIELTERHRNLWERMNEKPELARILEADVNLAKRPVTAEEETFVIFILLHLSDTYYALRAGLFPKLHGLSKDIELFFSLPIPHVVWEKVKALQDEQFVRFVESCFQKPVMPQGPDSTSLRQESAATDAQPTGQQRNARSGNQRRRHRGDLARQQTHPY